MNQLEAMLKELGLNEYEAKTFVTLVSRGTCNAEEISNNAGIPLPRVYDTVNHLEKKGFVMVTKTRPQQYKSISPDEALQNFLNWKNKEFKTDLENLKSLSNRINEHVNSLSIETKPQKQKWRIWTTEGKKSIVSMRRNIFKKAENEILIMTGDASFVKDDYTILKKIAKNGIKFKLIISEPWGNSREIKENINKLLDLDFEIRAGYTGSLRGNIIDDSISTIVFKTGKDELNGISGTDKEFKYEMLVINNPFFVKIIKEYFDIYWENAEELK